MREGKKQMCHLYKSYKSFDSREVGNWKLTLNHPVVSGSKEEYIPSFF
jgi:hypothetical protein